VWLYLPRPKTREFFVTNLCNNVFELFALGQNLALRGPDLASWNAVPVGFMSSCNAGGLRRSTEENQSSEAESSGNRDEL